MNMKNLSIGIVAMVALAAIVLSGIAIVEEYSYQLRRNTASTQDEITLDEGTPVLVGTSGTFPYLQTLTSCVNSTGGDALSSTLYTVTEGDENGGFVTLASGNTDWNQTDVNCSLTYLADTDAQAGADNFTTGLAIFATFSAIVALSLVGKVIIGMFRKE